MDFQVIPYTGAHAGNLHWIVRNGENVRTATPEEVILFQQLTALKQGCLSLIEDPTNAFIQSNLGH